MAYLQGNGNTKQTIERSVLSKLFGKPAPTPKTTLKQPTKKEPRESFLNTRVTKAQKAKLAKLSAATGQAQSEIVRKSLQVFEASRKGGTAFLNGYILDFKKGRMVRGKKSNKKASF